MNPASIRYSWLARIRKTNATGISCSVQRKRARPRHRHARGGERHEKPETNHLRGEADDERGLRAGHAGANQQCRRNERADRVLAIQSLHAPDAPPLWRDPAIDRLIREVSRDGDIDAGVSVVRPEARDDEECRREEERRRPPGGGSGTMGWRRHARPSYAT
jgi:hypothetical protein